MTPAVCEVQLLRFVVRALDAIGRVGSVGYVCVTGWWGWGSQFTSHGNFCFAAIEPHPAELRDSGSVGCATRGIATRVFERCQVVAVAMPDRPTVKVIQHGYREYDGYTVDNVALETLPGFYCTGNLYRPRGGKSLQPAILGPHGHFRPWGRFRESHQVRCAQFARMAATVFSYGMVGWQDSRQTTHDDPWVLALQTWNSICVVDYLTGLPRVDPRRVGVTGASGGGSQSLFLGLVDRRVKVVVIVYDWAAPEGCLCEGGMPVMRTPIQTRSKLPRRLRPAHSY